MKRNVILWDGWKRNALLQWVAAHGRTEDMALTLLAGDDPHAEEFLSRREWDYLLIFSEKGHRAHFDDIVRRLGLPPQFVVHALDSISWAEHPAAFYALLKADASSPLQRQVQFLMSRSGADYATVTAEGLSYIGSAKDDAILPWMAATGQNYARGEMHRFYELAHRYYAPDDSRGYFLDIGANIGTTGIYFTKKLTPGLKLLAFEPDSDNYRMLCCNLLLNRLSKADAIAERLGLGASAGEQLLCKNPENPGGNGMYPFLQGMATEPIQMDTLDSCLERRRIPPEEVRYIWMDAEGFEAQAIVGAQRLLLRHRPIPLFMELNPLAWEASGFYGQMMAVLGVCYTHFIALKEKGAPQPHAIGKLWELRRSTNWIGSLGDIFLFRQP